MDDLIDTRLPTLTVDELADRLCLLAGRLAAAECEFLKLLAEFDAREGWAAVGVRSAAHWLSWRCGLTLGSARERVRVARALTLLPRVRDSLRVGELSYCKVRALTRVATPPTEQELLDIARGATGAQLERVTRAWRTTLVTEMSASQHLRRCYTRRREYDGSVVYTLRVAADEAPVIDAALAAARTVVLDDDGQPVETPEETRLAAELTDAPPIVRASADAFVLMAESFLTSGVIADAGDAHRVVIHADLAALQQVTSGVADARHDSPVHHSPDGDEPLPLRVRAMQRQQCSVEDGSALAPTTVLRHLCQVSARVMLEAEAAHPLDLGRSARHASPKQREALRARDGGCRFPSCTQRRRLIPHHVEWWSRGGATDLDNLVLLCPAHHRAVHEIGYTVRGHGRGRFSFFRPDGRRLEPAPQLCADGAPPPTTVAVEPTSIQPTWGGERLDLGLLIWAMSSNALIRDGHNLLTLSDRELPAALRAAVQWPPGTRTTALAS